MLDAEQIEAFREMYPPEEETPQAQPRDKARPAGKRPEPKRKPRA